MRRSRISEAVIRRLPRYYRHMQELSKSGEERISSHELSERLNLNASQVRQDFNCFGGFGQQGYGYNVKSLKNELEGILGLKQQYGIIIVGAGNIGQALANYSGFEKEGFRVKAIYDVNPAVIGKTIGDVVVQNVEKMDTFEIKDDICIGVISTQKNAAQQAADKLVSLGVKAIWNFAPVDVHVPIPIENAHLSDALYILSYRINNN